jgi:predicted amidophosphoribosyltransferase
MAEYRCPECGKESDRSGMCPHCKKEYSRECPICGEKIEDCTCREDIPQTKGHAPR